MRFLSKASCRRCGKSFRSAEEMMQHEQVSHGKDLPYDCRQCNVSFSNMHDMRAHIQKFHSYKKDRA